MFARVVGAAAMFAMLGSFAFADDVGVTAPTVQELTLASAPAGEGSFYGSLSIAGMSIDASFTQNVSLLIGSSGDATPSVGAGVVGAFGYDYGNGVRIELELANYHGNTGQLSFPNAGVPLSVDTDGTYRLTTAMVNGWYTFGTGSVRPFVGAGLGFLMGSVDISPIGGLTPAVTESDTSFGYMVGAGVEIPVSNTVSVAASYRYLAADGFATNSIGVDFSSHVVTLGALVRF